MGQRESLKENQDKCTTEWKQKHMSKYLDAATEVIQLEYSTKIVINE